MFEGQAYEEERTEIKGSVKKAKEKKNAQEWKRRQILLLKFCIRDLENGTYGEWKREFN